MCPKPQIVCQFICSHYKEADGENKACWLPNMPSVAEEEWALGERHTLWLRREVGSRLCSASWAILTVLASVLRMWGTNKKC